MALGRRQFLGRMTQMSAASALIFPTVQSAPDLESQLTEAAARGGGDVSVAEGTIEVPRTLVVEANVNLRLSRAARLVATANVPVVEVKIGGRLGGGGTIDFRKVPDFSQAGVVINSIPLSVPNTHTFIGDLLIVGAAQPNSSGIRLAANGAGTRITWVKVWGVDVIRAYHGVLIDVNGTGQPAPGVNAHGFDVHLQTWINANRFDVDVQEPVFGFTVNAQGTHARATGNWFRGQLQTSRKTQRAVYCEGDYNRFDLFVWDWQSNVPQGVAAVEFTPASRRNELCVPSLSAKDVLDRGLSNRAAFSWP